MKNMYGLYTVLLLLFSPVIWAQSKDVVGKVTNLPVIINPSLNQVLAERGFELAFEGFKIHEIKRLKQSFSIYSWNDNILVFPIPQIEVDATSGILIQNPGY